MKILAFGLEFWAFLDFAFVIPPHRCFEKIRQVLMRSIFGLFWVFSPSPNHAILHTFSLLQTLYYNRLGDMGHQGGSIVCLCKELSPRHACASTRHLSGFNAGFGERHLEVLLCSRILLLPLHREFLYIPLGTNTLLSGNSRHCEPGDEVCAAWQQRECERSLQ